MLAKTVYIICVFMFLCTRLVQFQSSSSHVIHEQQFHRFLGYQPTIKLPDSTGLKDAYLDSNTYQPVENEFDKLLGDTNNDYNR